MNNNGKPMDLRAGWLKVSRSMQAQSCKQRGFAVLSVRIVVDNLGNPLFWTEPEMTKIEPAASDALPKLLENLTKL